MPYVVSGYGIVFCLDRTRGAGERMHLLLSEDLQTVQRLNGLQIVNPFA
ncbi:MAG: hypothetical protein ACREX9_09725 [Gammaproteobacteria bacterium]